MVYYYILLFVINYIDKHIVRRIFVHIRKYIERFMKVFESLHMQIWMAEIMYIKVICLDKQM